MLPGQAAQRHGFLGKQAEAPLKRDVRPRCLFLENSRLLGKQAEAPLKHQCQASPRPFGERRVSRPAPGHQAPALHRVGERGRSPLIVIDEAVGASIRSLAPKQVWSATPPGQLRKPSTPAPAPAASTGPSEARPATCVIQSRRTTRQQHMRRDTHPAGALLR